MPTTHFNISHSGTVSLREATCIKPYFLLPYSTRISYKPGYFNISQRGKAEMQVYHCALASCNRNKSFASGFTKVSTSSLAVATELHACAWNSSAVAAGSYPCAWKSFACACEEFSLCVEQFSSCREEFPLCVEELRMCVEEYSLCVEGLRMCVEQFGNCYGECCRQQITLCLCINSSVIFLIR